MGADTAVQTAEHQRMLSHDSQSDLESQTANRKIQAEVFKAPPEGDVKDKSPQQAFVQPGKAADGRVGDQSQQFLPALSLNGGVEKDHALPWNDSSKTHMSYRQTKDAKVKLGEGPFHVAQRLLGPGAKDGDVKALTDAMTKQFLDEHADNPKMESLSNGHWLLNEQNIGQIVNRIPDLETRQRIIDRLKEGFTDKEQPAAVPFPAHNRPGETMPNRIEDPDEFMKDLAAAAIDVGAAAYRAKGQCAAGFRLAINEIPMWHIEGGTVDVSINKDINGWRSGVQMALDFAQTGLFDVIPLSKLGYKNLKEGYIVGRYHYPDYVKDHPSWKGEDFGDIDVMTKKHKPPDDGDMYHDSFVLIPKRPKKPTQ